MKKFLELLKIDFIYYAKYHFISIITVVSLLFGLTIGLTNFLPPMIYIYISVFVIPVLTFSVSLFIEQQQRSKITEINKCPPGIYTLGRIISATMLQFIPMITYLIVLIFVLNYQFNVFSFILVYLLGSAMHIMIGLSLSIIAKTSFALSMSYIVYLIIFSIIPIFYSVDMIPSNINYLLVISPAYLSGVLFEQIIHPSALYENWFTYLSIFLQLTYIGVLFNFVVKPFSDEYLKIS